MERKKKHQNRKLKRTKNKTEEKPELNRAGNFSKIPEISKTRIHDLLKCVGRSLCAKARLSVAECNI